MTNEASSVVTVYTDGGCIGNPGPGGWAAILQFGPHCREISGRFRETTNNRMELQAAIAALESLQRPCQVKLYTDSTYVRNGITQWVQTWQRNGWRTAGRKPVKNKDLWQRLLVAIARHQPAGGITWIWVKGHAGHQYNEAVDRLANQAARSVTPADPLDRVGSEFGTTTSVG